jgi:predicted DNA-binding transcriptional regulator YafY
MRRADRLFDIIQCLRLANGPVTAAALSATLEVTVRTVYRDIAALQASRVPIEGAPGLGYILRPGFHLPPLMFTMDEIDAIAVGVRLVRRIRDAKLQEAAERVLAKVAIAVPSALRAHLASAPLYVSEGSAVEPRGIDLSEVRSAIRGRRKIRISYRDERARGSKRTIWPIAVAYYVDVTVIAAWCELRNDYRHFRVERIETAQILDSQFEDDYGRLLGGWLALRKDGLYQHARE